MAEENSCEWPFALRNDQIRRDRPTLRTRVRNVVKSASVELFDYFVMDIERRLRVVIEKMQRSLVVRCCLCSLLISTRNRFGHDLCCLGDDRFSVIRSRC